MIVLGVDAHKRTHTVVAADRFGAQVAALTVAAAGEGHLRLLRWAEQFRPRRWAVEDCRGLSRRLEADLLGAKAIARRRGQAPQIRSQHRHAAALGPDDTADQGEQRTLAAAAGSVQEHAFARRDAELGQIETGRVARPPAEDDAFEQDRPRRHAQSAIVRFAAVRRAVVCPLAVAICARMRLMPGKKSNNCTSSRMSDSGLVQTNSHVPRSSAWASS